MKTFLFITKITINGNTNTSFYSDYSAALRSAILYVDEAEEIEIEIQTKEEGKEWYIFHDYTRIKTEEQLGINEESAK